MLARLLVCALLIGTFGITSAQETPAPAPQQPAARQLTPEQRAAIQKQNQVLEKYAESIIAMIDNGQIGQVWDEASEVAKHSVGRDQFVKTIEGERSKLGKVGSRKLTTINRSLSKGGKLPEGMYVNVNYATQFANQPKPIRELVSFHLDGDKKWRLSGYTVSTPAAK
ncbi:MAG: DUF4019 domain-containing protein [Xanthomonadales bacterium]|nr:DUF4019 domain-containing protein [Xanthomonadales bacterium]ODU91643.1 MAG: hypothetical protein ABT18_15385 [Rhodanobacter sp. SCN 66-43]OJY86586.1 MAG: hypothetical protein BGP23_03055 [Xanthomonadales bacterium 66-474]